MPFCKIFFIHFFSQCISKLISQFLSSSLQRLCSCSNFHLFDLYSFEILRDRTAERQNLHLKSKKIEVLQSRNNSKVRRCSTKHIKEKSAVICQGPSFSCRPLAARLFKNLNSSVYLQEMFFFFLPFTLALLFPEPRDVWVSGEHSMCLWGWVFFLTLSLIPKQYVKKRGVVGWGWGGWGKCHVLWLLIQEGGKEKCCPLPTLSINLCTEWLQRLYHQVLEELFSNRQIALSSFQFHRSPGLHHCDNWQKFLWFFHLLPFPEVKTVPHRTHL